MVGDVADEILAVQGEVKALNAAVDALELKKKGLTEELMKLAEEQKLTKGGGKNSKFTIKPHTVPNVSNWDLFYEYMYEKKYLHLLQRRPGVQACAELWSKDIMIPGVEQFTSMKATVGET